MFKRNTILILCLIFIFIVLTSILIYFSNKSKSVSSKPSSSFSANDDSKLTNSKSSLKITLGTTTTNVTKLDYYIKTLPQIGTLIDSNNVTITTNSLPYKLPSEVVTYRAPEIDTVTRTVSFIFYSNDSWTNSNDATITITINFANRKPISNNVDPPIIMDNDTGSTITLSGSDPDTSITGFSESITYQITELPTIGNLRFINSTDNLSGITPTNPADIPNGGTIVYIPSILSCNRDTTSFKYRVKDNRNLFSEESTVTIMIVSSAIEPQLTENSTITATFTNSSVTTTTVSLGGIVTDVGDVNKTVNDLTFIYYNNGLMTKLSTPNLTVQRVPTFNVSTSKDVFRLTTFIPAGTVTTNTSNSAGWEIPGTANYIFSNKNVFVAYFDLLFKGIQESSNSASVMYFGNAYKFGIQTVGTKIVPFIGTDAATNGFNNYIQQNSTRVMEGNIGVGNRVRFVIKWKNSDQVGNTVITGKCMKDDGSITSMSYTSTGTISAVGDTNSIFNTRQEKTFGTNLLNANIYECLITTEDFTDTDMENLVKYGYNNTQFYKLSVFNMDKICNCGFQYSPAQNLCYSNCPSGTTASNLDSNGYYTNNTRCTSSTTTNIINPTSYVITNFDRNKVNINLDNGALPSTDAAQISDWTGYTQSNLSFRPTVSLTGGLNNTKCAVFTRSGTKYDDSLSRVSNSVFNPNSNGGFTIIFAGSFDGTRGNNEHIFNAYTATTNGTNGFDLQFRRNGTTGSLSMNIRKDTATNELSYVSEDSRIVQNRFNVFIFRYDKNDTTGGPNGTMRLWYNNNGVRTLDTPITSTATSVPIDRLFNNIIIGDSRFSEDNSFNGKMSFLMLYSSALSDNMLDYMFNYLVAPRTTNMERMVRPKFSTTFFNIRYNNVPQTLTNLNYTMNANTTLNSNLNTGERTIS